MRVLITTIVYLCVNIVAGTFVSLPIDEKLFGLTNLMTDSASLKVMGSWYSVGFLLIWALYAWRKRKASIHYEVAGLAIVLWMGSAIDFRVHLPSQEVFRCSINAAYYIYSFAVAVVAQILAIQAVEPIWNSFNHRPDVKERRAE